jgi:spermidine synthase
MDAGLLLMALIPGLLFAKSTLKDQPGLITEIESPYNYIQVFDRNGVRSVAVNEGQAQQSIYRPDGHLSGGIWDLFLLAPQFMAKPKSPKNLLIIGLAAGTVAKEYSRIFGPLPIDGVEIDQTMVNVGQKYMSMTEPNLRVIVMDGRAFLSQTQTRYDIIVLDAYHQPYIPFHLATVEFFGLVREHLTPHGVVALNAARTLTDFRLVNSLATTMHQVFPTVIALDHPVDANSLLIAPNGQFADDEFRFTRTGDGELDSLMSDIHPRLATAPGVLLTDDRAPIENLIHEIILDFVVQR